METEYTFGRPAVYLTPVETARLLVWKSKLADTLWIVRPDEDGSDIESGMHGPAVLATGHVS